MSDNDVTQGRNQGDEDMPDAGLSADSSGITSSPSDCMSPTQDVAMTNRSLNPSFGLTHGGLPPAVDLDNLDLLSTFSDMNSDWSDHTNDGAPQGTFYRKVSRHQGRSKHFAFYNDASVSDIKEVVGKAADRMTRRFPGYEVEVVVRVHRRAPLPDEVVDYDDSSEDQQEGGEARGTEAAEQNEGEGDEQHGAHNA